ncbi:MAG: hypothetical protein NZM28_02755 [Fimbriimonadales bacterium]|nr:hypothetical protein [Fimbriimonadales bacterium]
MQGCVAVNEKEALYSDGKRLGVYLLGKGQIRWTARFAESVQAGCLTDTAVYAITSSTRLHRLPRQPHEPVYALPLPRAAYAALFVERLKPLTLVLLASTGEVFWLSPPDDQVQRLALSRHALVNGCVSSEGDLIVSDKQGQVYLLRGRRVTRQWEGGTGGLADLATHPSQTYVAGAGIDGIIRVWDYSTGRLHTALAGHRWDVQEVAFAEQGDLLVTIGSDGQALVWHWQRGQLPQHTLRLPEPPLSARLQRDAQGRIWLLTPTHMYRLDWASQQWHAVTLQNLSQKET